MHPGFLAFASGGLLYVASAAMGSVQASGVVRGLAWLAVAAVVLCHAGLGFFAIGDRRAEAVPSTGIFVVRAAASLLMTVVALTAAFLAVVLFPISMAPNMALSLVALSALASAVALTLAAGRVLRNR